MYVKMRTILAALPAAAAVLLVIHGATWAIRLALVLIVVTMGLIQALWRCPHCKRYMGKNFEKGGVCPQCGKKLD